jgi:hypothetical protein
VFTGAATLFFIQTQTPERLFSGRIQACHQSRYHRVGPPSGSRAGRASTAPCDDG